MFDKFTNRAKQVIKLAKKESQRMNHNYLGTEHVLMGLLKLGQGVAVNVLRNLNHNYVGTEHLLLGLLRQSDGVAAHVLESLNVNLKEVRKEVLRELESFNL